MKKSLALILAAMMVAGTASVAFAASTEPNVYVGEGSQLYRWDKDKSVYVKIDNGTSVRYGDKVAIALKGDDNDDKKEVNKNKVFPDWKVGSSLVENADIQYRKTEEEEASVEYIVKQNTKPIELTVKISGKDMKLTVVKEGIKAGNFNDKEAAMKSIRNELAKDTVMNNGTSDFDWMKITSDERDAIAKKVADVVLTEKENEATRGYKYLVVIELKDSTSTKTQDLSGDVRVGKTITDAKNNKDDGYFYNLELEVKNDKTDEKIGDDKDTVTVNLDKYNDNYVLDVADDAGVTDIEFGKDGELALFTVDLDGQSDVNVGYSTKFNADIADKYPAANLEFIKWTANPTFNRTGDLYIYADEDSFIYEVTADGLKEISKAEYDEDYGAWKIRTRKLGSYVISDEELDVTASTSSSEASSSGTSSSNPVTGGTTGTTGGNTNVKPNPNTGR